jgi:hypothetical protein
MKNLKLMKIVVVLFAVFAFSNCEESGDPVQFVVVDEIPTSIAVTGLEGKSAYSVTNTADISSLLDNAAVFVEAKIETVSLKLSEYNGTSIEGNIKITVGGNVIFNESKTLSSTAVTLTIPESASDILSDINSGTVTLSMEGSTTEPISDNDFVIIVTPTVRATF